MVLRLNLFWKELFLFGLTLFIGIFSAYNHALLIEKRVIEPTSYSWDGIMIFLALFVILMLVVMRFKRLTAVSLKFFLLLVVFSGSQVVIGSLVSYPWDLIWALIVASVFLMIHNVLVHDFSIALGIAGISSLLSISISPETAVVLLVILSFYDIFAVYWTKHMVYMARGMIESGAIFGFVIPFEWRDFLYHKNAARDKIGEKFMILGSGDIGLPLIMASSLAVVSLRQAVITALFSLAGLFLTHLIFINQSGRRPMAALPPIATLTIIGYLISQLW
ncbi:MAG: presenilin family intramembrane aspartyl protease [Candidatus Taylorbacteria bacterium]|nr:presenilin family intramembrane aspartyl protease [Candidatus Taylorbacteria bacterium]